MHEKTIATYNRSADAYDQETTGYWNKFSQYLSVMDNFIRDTRGGVVLDAGLKPYFFEQF